MNEKIKSEDVDECALRPYRKWNTEAFAGKYHLGRFANRLHPIPGTQVLLEQNYEIDKEIHSRNFQHRLDENSRIRKKQIEYQIQSVALRTDIFFDTIIGEPIRQTERIINEKEDFMNKSYAASDQMKTVEKFMSNMALGRHYFVGYSIASGYKSMNYQDPRTGDTALHIAVRNGHPNVVEELLKYKAEADVKNGYGYHPCHLAWMFWKTHFNRTKEEREAQEEKTRVILLNVFSYGGYVDATDLDGETPLHIACRLGSLQVVKTILSFKADILLEYKGELPHMIAARFGHDEIAKLVEAWGLIRRSLVNFDFSVVWSKFLRDSNAVISAAKSSEQILLEIEMENNIKKLGRDQTKGLPIDDPLIQQTYNEAHSVYNKKIPKPWEPGWERFVAENEKNGIKNLKEELDALTKMQANKKKKDKEQRASSIAGGSHHLPAKSRFPDRSPPNPVPRKLSSIKSMLDTPDLTATASTMARDHENGHDIATFSDEENGQSNAIQDSSHTIGDGDGDVETSDNDDEDDDEDQAHPDEIFNPYFVRKKKSKNSSKKGQTAAAQRRKAVAVGVALDGKFLRFTHKSSLSSGMLLSQRTPAAPMLGTEEEGSILRMLVAQVLSTAQ